jgi:hypothetical protein
VGIDAPTVRGGADAGLPAGRRDSGADAGEAQAAAFCLALCPGAAGRVDHQVQCAFR